MIIDNFIQFLAISCCFVFAMKSERKGAGVPSSSKRQQQQNGPNQSLPPKETSPSAAPSLCLASQSIAGKGHQTQQKQIFNEMALRNNAQVLEQSRTCQAALSGMASGILGLTGTLGFLFYFLCVFLQAFVWHYKTGFRWTAFFTNRSLFLTHSVVSGLFTYVLFWVFVYGLVHVY